MNDITDPAEARKALRRISIQLSEHPFADVLTTHDGKFVSRTQARAIERELWPLAFPKVKGAVA